MPADDGGAEGADVTAVQPHEPVQPDEAIAFLRALQPDGPWVLDTAKGGRMRRHARLADDAAVRDFVQATAGRDTYALLGIPNEGVTGQPDKAAMRGAAVLWVDLDPRAGEDLEEGRARLHALANGRRPPGAPPPSLVVDSGRGLWMFWRLATPCTNPALVERHNQSLANLFGSVGDACHNINRIGRLPGTVNTKTGRVARLLREYSQPDATYDLADMPAPTRADPPPSLPTDAPPLCATIANAPRLTLEDLERRGVPDRVRVVVARGEHPEGPAKPSRSEWLFDATCNLLRAGLSPDEVFGVITNRDFGISDSVYRRADGGRVPNPEEYARRQIEKAQQAVVEQAEPELAELNAAHAVLMQQGAKARVLSWEASELEHGRDLPVLQTFEDFRNRYLNRTIAVPTATGAKQLPLGEWWLRHPRRRQYMAMRFLPGRPPEVDGYLNTWRGFGVEPRAGDWTLMREHIRDVLAAGDVAAADYITRWAAWAVQNPGEPAEVALVFQGGRGTGKGTFARALKQLFGQHGLQVTSPGQLTGRFNAHMQDCCLLFADEAIAPGDKAAESVLKGLITEPELTIEGKGVNAVQARNRLHIVMASNDEWVVPAGVDERRFAVFRVADARRGDHDHFAALHRQMADGGLAAMLHHLLALDLAGWHPRRNVPKTLALQQQKDLSLGPAEQFVLGILESGDIAAARAPGRGHVVLSNDEGQQPGIYTAMRRASPRLRDWSAQRLASVLKDWGCESRRNGAAQRGWVFPPLAKMRERWDARIGPRVWGEPNDWTETCDAAPPY
jgi:hypothetical protein